MAPSCFSVEVTMPFDLLRFQVQIDTAVDLLIDWGDASSDVYNGDDLREHYYNSPGKYTISFVSGTASYISFGHNHVMRPDVVSAVLTPVPISLGLDDCEDMFCSCTGIISWAPRFFDAASANVYNMLGMFDSCYQFNEDISGWDTSNVTDMSVMFYDCALFNQNISGWDMSNVITTYSMFSGCSAFSQDIGGWNTSNVSDMRWTFSGCTAFNRDVSGWNIQSLLSAASMFVGSGFAQDNYDRLLVGWSAQFPQQDVKFHAGSAKYGGGAPAAARVNLVDNYGWIITDGGPAI